jgi:hypothetical protein
MDKFKVVGINDVIIFKFFLMLYQRIYHVTPTLSNYHP